MIDRYLLRYFLAVVDQGTFSRAATHCHVSQPTLSVGIAKLERLLGTALFFRSNQRVQLTEAGSRFLVHARRIESEFNLAQTAMSAEASMPMLRVGMLHSIPGALLASAVAAIPAADRGPRLEIIPGSERELVGHLARGRIDVAISLLGRGGDRFLEQPVWEEGYKLAMSLHHPLAQNDQIAAEDLADNVMIVRRHCEALAETSRHFTDRGVRPHFALRTTNDERVLQMVAAGLGITVMPDSYSHPGVAGPRLSGFLARRTIGFLYGHQAEHLQAEPSPVLRAFAEHLAARP